LLGGISITEGEVRGSEIELLAYILLVSGRFALIFSIIY
jgi:hypothetical protein